MATTEELLLRITGDSTGGQQAVQQMADGLKGLGGHGEQVGNQLAHAFEHPMDALKGLGGALVDNLAPGLGVSAIAATAATAGFAALGAAALASLDAVYSLATRAAEIGAGLGDMADKTGLSVPALSRLSQAATVAGTDLGRLTNVVFILERNMGNGGEAFEAGLRKMQLSTQQLKEAGPDGYLDLIARGLASIVDPADRASAGSAVLGRAYKDSAAALQDLGKAMALTNGMDVWTQRQSDEAEAATMKIAAMKLQYEELAISAGKELIPALNALADVLPGLATDFAKGADHGLAFDLVLLGLKEQAAAARASLDVLLGRAAQLPDALGPAAKGVDAWRTSVAALQALMPTLAQATATEAVAIKALEHAHHDAAAAMKKAAEDAKKHADEQHKLANELLKVEHSLRDIPDALQKIGRSYDESKLGTLVNELGKIERNAHIATFGFKGMTDELTNVGYHVAKTGDELNDFARFEWAGPIQQRLRTLGETTAEVFQKIPQMVTSALTGGGGIVGAMQGIGSLAGASLGQTIGKKIASLGNLGGPIGAAIGSLAGPLIQIFAELFDHTGHHIARDAGEKFGTTFSKATIDAIKKDIKSGFTEVAAELKNLSTIIKDAGGLTETNLSMMTARLHDVFSMIETHQLTIGQGTKILDENWAAFAKAGTNSLGMLNQKLIDIIALNDKFGTQSKEITQYLSGQAKTAETAFGSAAKVTSDAYKAQAADQVKLQELYSKLSHEQVADLAKIADLKKKMASADAAHAAEYQNQIWKLLQGQDATMTSIEAMNKELETQAGIIDATTVKSQASATAMGASIAAAFNQDIASGKSFAQAIADIGPGATDLAAVLQKTGFTGGAAFDLITEEVALAHDAIAGPALTAVNALSSGMVALGNMGKLDQQTFEGLGSQIANTFTSLVAQGKDGSAVMLAMQGPLQTLWEEEHRFGLKLDDSTQALLDEAEAAGVVGEKHKSSTDKMIDALGTLHTDLLGIVKALTGAGGVTDAFTTLGTHAKEQIDKIPKTIDIALNGHYNAPRIRSDGDGDDGAHAWRGGLVTSQGVQYLASGLAGLMAPRGTDTVPAMLTPGESVLTRAATSALGPAVIGMLNRGGRFDVSKVSMPSGGDVTINVHVDASGAFFRTREDTDRLATEVGNALMDQLRQATQLSLRQ